MKDYERRFVVIDMKTLRRISGIRRHDRVRNKDIRGRYGLATVVENCESSTPSMLWSHT